MNTQWDTLIRGALVFDGSGAAPVCEDVAIADGRIAARGANLEASKAREVHDAQGLWPACWIFIPIWIWK